MSEKRRPWGKWFWTDWRGDARLRRCSYAARGLWADMLSLMGGECEPFGFLLMEGAPLHADDLSRILGGSEREVSRMLGELEERRVFSRVGDLDIPEDVIPLLPHGLPLGTIFSRRMVRDKAKEDLDRAHGKSGGNPKLKPDGGGGVNPVDKAQTPESRHQKPEEGTNTLRFAPVSPARPSRKNQAEPEGFAEWYAVFPKHVARADAARAYSAALKKASREGLLAAAHRYAAEQKGQDPRYTKHPATWLNKGCWLDEPAPMAQRAAAPVIFEQANLRGWLDRLEGFAGLADGVKEGFWLEKWGPKPRAEGCRVPPEAFAEFRRVHPDYKRAESG